jgi:hypothetical protein
MEILESNWNGSLLLDNQETFVGPISSVEVLTVVRLITTWYGYGRVETHTGLDLEVLVKVGRIILEWIFNK